MSRPDRQRRQPWSPRRLVAVCAALSAAMIGVAAPLAAGADPALAAGACDLVAAKDGSDSATGTPSAPFATAQKLVDELDPGETGCLRQGGYQENVSFFSGGSSDERVTLRGYPGERAELLGQFYIDQRADNVLVEHLRLNGRTAPDCTPGASCATKPSVVIYGDDVTLRDNDVTNDNRAICFLVGNVNLPSTKRLTVEHNLVHDCGQVQPTNHDHGMYVEHSEDAVVQHNVFQDNINRGIQIYPRSIRTRVRHNVFDGNGQNVHFGEQSRENVVEGNLITNARLGFNVQSYQATGTGNVVRSNCINAARHSGSPAGSGLQSPQVGFTASGNVFADPLYRDRADGDYRLRDGSPCAELFGDTEAGPRPDTADAGGGDGGGTCEPSSAPRALGSPEPELTPVPGGEEPEGEPVEPVEPGESTPGTDGEGPADEDAPSDGDDTTDPDQDESDEDAGAEESDAKTGADADPSEGSGDAAGEEETHASSFATLAVPDCPPPADGGGDPGTGTGGGDPGTGTGGGDPGTGTGGNDPGTGTGGGGDPDSGSGGSSGGGSGSGGGGGGSGSSGDGEPAPSTPVPPAVVTPPPATPAPPVTSSPRYRRCVRSRLGSGASAAQTRKVKRDCLRLAVRARRLAAVRR